MWARIAQPLYQTTQHSLSSSVNNEQFRRRYAGNRANTAGVADDIKSYFCFPWTCRRVGRWLTCWSLIVLFTVHGIRQAVPCTICWSRLVHALVFGCGGYVFCPIVDEQPGRWCLPSADLQLVHMNHLALTFAQLLYLHAGGGGNVYNEHRTNIHI